jgi:hypothetical protein
MASWSLAIPSPRHLTGCTILSEPLRLMSDEVAESLARALETYYGPAYSHFTGLVAVLDREERDYRD